MELSMESMQLMHFTGDHKISVSLENDMNVPDINPDIIRVIEACGMVKIDEARTKEQKVVIKGGLEFNLLYLSDQNEQKFCKMTGNIPFEEVTKISGLADKQDLRVYWEMEDLQVQIINSRKISVRAIIALNIVTRMIFEEKAATISEVAKDVYCKGEKIVFEKLHNQKRDIVRIKKEIQVPSMKADIKEIIWEYLIPGKIDFKVLDHQIKIKGSMHIFLLYTAALEDHPIQYFSYEFDFESVMECTGITEEMLGHIESKMIQSNVKAKTNVDGEFRICEVEFVLEIQADIYSECRLNLITDMYSNKYQLRPKWKNIMFDCLVIQNQSVAKISDHIAIKDQKTTILQICHTSGHIKIDKMVVENGGIKVEGVVYVQILYIAADDDVPLASIKGLIPFEHLIECTGDFDSNMHMEVRPTLSGIRTLMSDSDEIELKIEIGFKTIIFKKQEITIIADVESGALEDLKLQEQPRIIGYIVQPKDSLWDLAKKYKTTIEQIMIDNDLHDERIKTGDKLLLLCHEKVLTLQNKEKQV